MIQSVNSEYSTTRNLTREKPHFDNSLNSKMQPLLFLPQYAKRIAQGGLRLHGSYKSRDINQKPLITVVTVVFNGVATLEETILSVINQSYDNVEFIIIDGGSTDGTLDIIRKYENAIDYWVSEQDKGIYDAFNKAVICATGEWICFLGADDFFWGNDVLEKLAMQLISIPTEILVVYSQVMWVNENGETLYSVGQPWQKVKHRFKYMMTLPHQALMHRRKLFEKHGLFNNTFKIAGDYELLLRELKTENAIFIPEIVLTGMRQGGVSSNPANLLRSLKEVNLARKINNLHEVNTFIFVSYIRNFIRIFFEKILGKKICYFVMDLLRLITGRSRYWTKL